MAVIDRGMPAPPASLDVVTIEIRSSIPDRERWGTGALRGRPRLALQLSEWFRTVPGVRSVTANAELGSVLLLYEPETVVGSMEELRRTVAVRIAAFAGRSHVPKADEGGLCGTELKASAVLLPVVVGATAFMPFSALAIAGSACATGLLLLHYFRKSRRTAAAASLGPGRNPALRILDIMPGMRRRVAGAAALSAIGKLLNITPLVVLGLTVRLLSSGPLPFLALLGIASVGGQLIALASARVVLWAAEAGLEYATGAVSRHCRVGAAGVALAGICEGSEGGFSQFRRE